MQKTYVLDANVLLQAPYALESFEDNHIVLPLAVLEELDDRKGLTAKRETTPGRCSASWRDYGSKETW